MVDLLLSWFTAPNLTLAQVLTGRGQVEDPCDLPVDGVPGPLQQNGSQYQLCYEVDVPDEVFVEFKERWCIEPFDPTQPLLPETPLIPGDVEGLVAALRGAAEALGDRLLEGTCAPQATMTGQVDWELSRAAGPLLSLSEPGQLLIDSEPGPGAWFAQFAGIYDSVIEVGPTGLAGGKFIVVPTTGEAWVPYRCGEVEVPGPNPEIICETGFTYKDFIGLLVGLKLVASGHFQNVVPCAD